MPVRLEVLLDKRELHKKLFERGEVWAQAIDYTMSDMRDRGPSKIAKIASETYNLKPAKLNPRNKKTRGSVSLSGGLENLTFTYRGSATPIKEFKPVEPGGYQPTPYQLKVPILVNKKTIIGHWYKPGSEGGSYSQESPWMYIPRKSKYGPVKRISSATGLSPKKGRGRRAKQKRVYKWDGGKFGPAVPQMVVSARTDDRTYDELTRLLEQRLTHHLKRSGLV